MEAMWESISPREVAEQVASELRGLGYNVTPSDIASLEKQVAEQIQRRVYALKLQDSARESLEGPLENLRLTIDSVARLSVQVGSHG